MTPVRDTPDARVMALEVPPGNPQMNVALPDVNTASDVAAVAAFVKNPKAPMPKLHPTPLNDAAVDAVSKYVTTLGGQ